MVFQGWLFLLVRLGQFSHESAVVSVVLASARRVFSLHFAFQSKHLSFYHLLLP